MDNTINFFNTTLTENSINYVLETLKSTLISAGKQADLFEDKLSDFGLINPVTLNSGTATLHLALLASGVGSGDEVIIPSQTFIATGMAVLQVGATPVFADINLYDGNISVESIKKNITKKTKAIIPVHWGGYPCDMDEINDIASEYNLSVIEDAAHAFGSTYKNKLIGTLSRFTSFSFQAIKHLTTGDGGALCCLNKEDEILVKRLRWFDIDRENSKTGFLGEREYDAENIGYKYHMNDIAASLGIGNLEKIKEKLKRIKKIADTYTKELKNINNIKLMDYDINRTSSYWLYPILVEDRKHFIEKMKNEKIPVSVVHLGIDKNRIFGGKNNKLVNQRIFDDKQIHLPINSDLTDEQVLHIINTIKNIYNEK
jgi:perosamine synthetase